MESPVSCLALEKILAPERNKVEILTQCRLSRFLLEERLGRNLRIVWENGGKEQQKNGVIKYCAG